MVGWKQTHTTKTIRRIKMNHRMDDRYLTKAEVLEITTLSESTIRRLEIDGRFPRRFKISNGTNRWWESEVMEWKYGHRSPKAA